MWKPTLTYSYYQRPQTSDELYHFGILGMKWGKKNGPPYPLDASDHSESEKKAGYQKSIKKGSGGSSDSDGVGPTSTSSIIETDNTLQKADSLIKEFNKTKTNAFGKKKREELRKQWNEELRKIDKNFSNPEVQKHLLKRAITDEITEDSIAADHYLDNKVRKNFGDWYFSEYKSDRAKKAYEKSQAYEKQRDDVYKKIREYELKVTRDGKELTKEEENDCRSLAKKREELYDKSWKTIVTAAMEDCGFDKSVINDPEMQKKMKMIVMWD